MNINGYEYTVVGRHRWKFFVRQVRILLKHIFDHKECNGDKTVLERSSKTSKNLYDLAAP